MNIKLVNRGTEGELLLEGRLDTTTSPDADTIFTQMSERFDKIILNMAGLEYISSAGLRVLKKLHMAMARKGGDLILTHTGPMVMEVFEMTGFAGLLNIEE